jgi:hypothetical protein
MIGSSNGPTSDYKHWPKIAVSQITNEKRRECRHRLRFLLQCNAIFEFALILATRAWPITCLNPLVGGGLFQFQVQREWTVEIDEPTMRIGKCSMRIGK